MIVTTLFHSPQLERAIMHLVGRTQAPASLYFVVIYRLRCRGKGHPRSTSLREMYAGVPFRTKADVAAKSAAWVRQRQREVLTWRVIFFAWVAVLPASYAVFEFFGPEWFGAIVLAYVLWKTGRAGQRVLGHAKRSRAEEERAEKERKMKHYFYHCERNPKGFLHLEIENLNEDAQ